MKILLWNAMVQVIAQISFLGFHAAVLVAVLFFYVCSFCLFESFKPDNWWATIPETSLG